MTVRPTVPRLALASLTDGRPDLLPPYDRTLAPSLVHIGVGAFARAHLGTFADDLSREGRPLLIRGISLHSTRAEDELGPQDCLYSVTETDGAAPSTVRVRGAFTSIATGPKAAVEAIAAPETEMVTLTLTEKGYAVPDDKHEVSGRLSSGPGVVALGLAARRQAGLRAPVIASLDNLRQNGEVLRQAVMACAARFDPALVQWIADEVAFPSSVVDRMVPAPTASDREEASRVLGLLDLAGVKTEPHRSWVMTAVAGAPPLDTVGVRFVADVTPYEERKLRLLNGPHSALAYTGLAMGCQTIAEATSQPLASGLVSRLIDDILEVVPTALPEPARPFAEDVFHRFTNPALKHTCSKVGADGSQKLPERFEAVVAARQHAGLPTGRFSAVAALWIAAASGLSLVSKTLPAVEDPMADHLARIADEGDLPGLVRAAVGGWTTEVLQREVLHMLDALRKGGVEMLGGLQ